MGETKEEHELAREYNFMASDILKDRKMHMLASLYFNKLGNLIFFISAVITLVQAGLAILAQADLNIDNWETHQSNIIVSIAFLAAFSVFWQSLVKNWNFNGRASLHDSAAAALGKLFKTAELKRRQEKASKTKKKTKAQHVDAGSSFSVLDQVSPSTSSPTQNSTPTAIETDSKKLLQRQSTLGSESSGDPTPAADEESSDLLDQLVKQYEQALEGCTSFVPPNIVSAFELLDNQIGVCKRRIDRGAKNDDEIRVEWEKVYPTLYRELYATIITQPLFPYRTPNPKYVVKETLKRFKDGVKDEKQKNIDLLGILLERNKFIEDKYDEFLNVGKVEEGLGGVN